MNFEVESEELKHAESTFTKSHDDFENYLKDWKEQIEQLKTIWNGSESTIFYKNMEEYLSKLDMLCASKNVFSEAFKYSHIIYEKKDEEFSKELHKENNQYDDKEYIAVSKKRKPLLEGEKRYEQ